MKCRSLPRSSGVLKHFASPDPGKRVMSHKRNSLHMVLNSFAVLHQARADMSANTAPMMMRERPLKEKRFIAAIAGVGISEKLGMFHAMTWTSNISMKANEKGLKENINGYLYR